MCRPPKPAPSQTSAQIIEAAFGNKNAAAAPSARKQAPITGIAGTEKVPPVMTPAPYNINHVPGIAAIAPARHKASVRTAPAINGGRKLNKNFLAGADQKGNPAARALCHIANTPTPIASTPSASQIASHQAGVLACEAKAAAARAVPWFRGCSADCRSRARASAGVPETVCVEDEPGPWDHLRATLGFCQVLFFAK